MNPDTPEHEHVFEPAIEIVIEDKTPRPEPDWKRSVLSLRCTQFDCDVREVTEHDWSLDYWKLVEHEYETDHAWRTLELPTDRVIAIAPNCSWTTTHRPRIWAGMRPGSAEEIEAAALAHSDYLAQAERRRQRRAEKNEATS